MNDNNHYIDKIFKEGLQGYSEEPEDELWAGISGEIAAGSSAATSTGKLLPWKKYAIYLGIFGVIALGTWILTPTSKTPSTHEKKIETHSEVEKPTEKVLDTSKEIERLSDQEAVPDEPVSGLRELTNEPDNTITESTSDKEAVVAESPTEGPEISQRPEQVKVDLDEPNFAASEKPVNEDIRPISEVPGPADFVPLNEQFAEALPVDSIRTTDTKKSEWKWFGGVNAVITPSYGHGPGLLGGVSIGRYVNQKSFVQGGLAFDTGVSQGDFGSGLLRATVDYNYLLGERRFKWLLRAGTSVSSEHAPSFRQERITSFGLDIGAGAMYDFNSKIRVFALPYFDSSEAELLFQIGIKLKF